MINRHLWKLHPFNYSSTTVTLGIQLDAVPRRRVPGEVPAIKTCPLDTDDATHRDDDGDDVNDAIEGTDDGLDGLIVRTVSVIAKAN